jgi:hypothetical protein
MNLLGQLFIDISNRLKERVPELKWIDQDFGQLERYKYRAPVSFPAALIDFAQATYEEVSQLEQITDLVITVRLAFAPWSQSYQDAPLDVKEKALEFYKIEQKVYAALHGWSPLPPAAWGGTENYTQPFRRMSAASEQREGDEEGLRVRVVTFTTQINDELALRIYQQVPVTSVGIDQEII